MKSRVEENDWPERVRQLVLERGQERRRGNYEVADRLRQELLDEGYELRDGGEVEVWREEGKKLPGKHYLVIFGSGFLT
jgi:cysteinyl-tRNA synthetase